MEFNGGHVPTGMEVHTVTFGDELGEEELDVLMPVRSSEDAIRVAAETILDPDYQPGLKIVAVEPFVGITVWEA